MEWAKHGAAKRQFEVFVADATDGLFRTAYLMTGNAADSEDLVQETFVRVARHWMRVRLMDHPFAYARRTLVNLALDSAAGRSRWRRQLQAAADSEPADLAAERTLRGIDDLAELRWALAQVTPGQRAVLVLRYWDGLPVDEVAAVLDCSAGTVKSAASRGAARLAAALAMSQGSDPAVAAAPRRRGTCQTAEGDCT